MERNDQLEIELLVLNSIIWNHNMCAKKWLILDKIISVK